MVIVQEGLLWALILLIIAGTIYTVIMAGADGCKIIHLKDEEGRRKYGERKRNEVAAKHRKVG